MPKEKVTVQELQSILADWIGAEDQRCAGVQPLVQESGSPDEQEGCNWSVYEVRFDTGHDETYCGALVDLVVERARERYEVE